MGTVNEQIESYRAARYGILDGQVQAAKADLKELEAKRDKFAPAKRASAPKKSAD